MRRRAGANPATLTDPTGHCPFCLLLIPIAIGFFAGAGVDAGIQQVTTGTVDWGQAGISGAIGAISGGVGGVAAAGARSAVTAVAKPIITRGIGYAAGIATQTVVSEGLGAAFVPKDERDDFGQNLATAAVTQVGTDLVLAGAKALPGKFGAIGRFIDGVFNRGGGKVDEPGVSAPDTRLSRDTIAADRRVGPREYEIQIPPEVRVTPGGISLTNHAALRAILPPPGRRPISPREIDEVLSSGTKAKYDPDRESIMIRSGRDKVVLNSRTYRVVTHVFNRRQS